MNNAFESTWQLSTCVELASGLRRSHRHKLLICAEACELRGDRSRYQVKEGNVFVDLLLGNTLAEGCNRLVASPPDAADRKTVLKQLPQRIQAIGGSSVLQQLSKSRK